MGKRSAKCHAQRKFDTGEKTGFQNLLLYLRDTFPDESNDSGLGSDASIIVPDSNSSRFLYDSDSLSDSSVSCSPNYKTPAAFLNRPRLSSHTVLHHIDSNLASSLNNKMRIQSADVEMKPIITNVVSLSEPQSAKRRKTVIGESGNSEIQDSRENVHGYGRQVAYRCATEMTPVSGVLTETSFCHNSNGKCASVIDSALTGDDCKDRTSRENFALHSNSTHMVRGGERIAALLSASSQSISRKRPLKKPSLHVCFPSRSKDGKAELSILIQPEEQHRARYMTEGSRGSIKDEKGTGFPTIKLCGYSKPVTLQMFIGSDTGKVQPHLFYQACKVTGKNCTPCAECMIEGTSVIEINMLPESEMIVSCDCIGILKERNVDVEQRLPYFGLARCKKRSTRCRMVFRVNIPLPNGNFETLQIASSQILCTQSPGLPEICKKSLTECSVKGGTELFIIGKNFQKDAKVLFQELTNGMNNDAISGKNLVWEEVVDPEKEFLHQSHIVCCVPPYRDGGMAFPVKVYLSVLSGGKSSEPHTFTYTPCLSASNGKYDSCHSPFAVGDSSSPLEYARNGLLSPNDIRLSSRALRLQSAVLNSAATANLDGILSPVGESRTVCSSHSPPESPTMTRNPTLTMAQMLSPQSHMRSCSTPSPITSLNVTLPTAAGQGFTSPGGMNMSMLSDGSRRQLSVEDVANLSAPCLTEMTHSSPPPPVVITPTDHIITPPLFLSPHLSPHRSARPHVSSFDVNTGHDIDLMSKIDQLATEMTTEGANRPLSSTVDGATIDVTRQEMSLVRVNSMAPLLVMTSVPSSDNHVAEKNDDAGGLAVSSAPSNTPPTSFVSTMINMKSDTISSSGNLFSVSNNSTPYLITSNSLSQNAMNVVNMQLMEGQRGDLDTKTHVSVGLNNSIVSFNGSSDGGGGIIAVENLQLPPASTGADVLTENSVSYNVQCCSAISQHSTVLSSSDGNGRGAGSSALQMFTNASSSAVQEVAPVTAALSEKLQSAAATAVSSAGSLATPSTTANSNKPDMNSMTLAFSQLSDADLLSMINPSAFDSV